MRPLSLWPWIAILAAVSVVRLVALVFLLPPTPALPDEVLYTMIVEGMVRGEAINDLVSDLGYGTTVVTGSWILTQPAHILVIFGVDPLISLRLVALTASTLAALLILAIAHRAYPQGVPLLSSAGLALLVLMVLPSYLLWGSLALRESSVILSMAMAAWGLSLVAMRPSPASQAVGLAAVFVGTVGMYMSRSYLALILSAAVLWAILFPPLRSRAVIVILTAGTLFLGNFVGSQIRTSAPPTLVPDNTVGSDTVGSDTVGSDTVGSDTVGSVIASRLGAFHRSREGLRLNADSAYSFNYCKPTGDAISTLTCEAANLPLGIYRFLLTPNVIETSATAPRQRLAAGFENLIWLVIFIAGGISVVIRRSLSPRLTVFLVTLLVLSTVAYALMSGNEGTAFRHKGQFLWAWCLLIVLGSGWRPWVRSLGRPKQMEVADSA